MSEPAVGSAVDVNYLRNVLIIF